MSNKTLELALTVLRRGTGIKYHEELEERRQAIKGLEAMLEREWVGLTQEEFDAAVPYCHNEFDLNEYKDFARAIEAKLKEKNT